MERGNGSEGQSPVRRICYEETGEAGGVDDLRESGCQAGGRSEDGSPMGRAGEGRGYGACSSNSSRFSGGDVGSPTSGCKQEDVQRRIADFFSLL
jgi:hypothetical protein